MTKATTAEGDQIRFGPNWVTARRGSLKVFQNHLECGDWKIGYVEIKESVLYSVRTNFVIPGYVLKVATENKTYHFGLNYGRFWKGTLPFEVQREKGKMNYSPFSIAVRVLLYGALAYWLCTKFFQ